MDQIDVATFYSFQRVLLKLENTIETNESFKLLKDMRIITMRYRKKKR